MLPDVGITHRRTTISTVGWLPGLRRFVDEIEEPIRLALSLHAATDELRSELMPANDRYPLADVLGECRRYFELRRRKVFVEYVMTVREITSSPQLSRHSAQAIRSKLGPLESPTAAKKGRSLTRHSFTSLGVGAAPLSAAGAA